MKNIRYINSIENTSKSALVLSNFHMPNTLCTDFIKERYFKDAIIKETLDLFFWFLTSTRKYLQCPLTLKILQKPFY